MSRYTFPFIFFLLWATHIHGQQVPDFIFKHLTVNDGLASNNVICTLQDSKGFWWIGTDNGLQRWDGYRFNTYNYNPDNKYSLQSDKVVKLMEDSRKNIWIGHLDGVTIYSVTKNLFTRVPIDTSEKVAPFKESLNSLFEDKWHNVWIAGNGTGLQWYNDSLGRFVSYTTKFPHYPFRLQFAAQQPSTGNYWFGTDSGLVCYDMATRKFFDKKSPGRYQILKEEPLQYPYTCFYLDNKENLWLSNWPQSREPYSPSYYAAHLGKDAVTFYNNVFINEVKSAVPDGYGRIWMGGGLLHYYNPLSNRFVEVKKQPWSKLGMDYDELNSVYCDLDGNMWLSTDNGAFVFDPGPKRINTYEADTGIIKDTDPGFAVTSFLEVDRDNIWVTTWGRGAFLYDSTFHIKKRIFDPGKKHNLYMARCATRSTNGHIWFGWQEGIMVDYDPANGKEFFMQPAEINNNTVRQLVADDNGNIWLGTQRGILAVCNTQTKQIRKIWDGEADGRLVGHIMSMKTDSKQHLWVGTTHSGLFEVDMKDGMILRHFSKPRSSLFFTDVIDMCFYNDTSLLLTSSGGIQILNTKTGKVSLFEYPAIRTNNIKAVEKGKDNDVYLAGPTGIFRINLAQMSLYVYGQRDGLLFNIFSEGAHITLSDGRVCFGTNRNFVSINDQQMTHAKNPVALISGIRIMNRAVPVDSLIRFKNVVELTHDHNYVALDFAAPSMMLHPNNSYLYKMEGFDRDWRIASQYPSAEYSNLPPGKYRFMVKYRNTDGEESSASTIIPFIIHPPFYLTGWFLAIATGLISLLVYLLHRIRVNKLLTMEKVRIHIARDLHDDMGSTLSSINILSLMSTRTIDKEPAKSKEYLSRISTYSQRMMESMDDIVWSINPLNDGMEKIVARMREVAATNLEPKEVDYRFYIDETVIHLKLDMGKRRDLFLIYKEAINNLAKYADCSKAIIHITAKNKRIIMNIEDNGCGFDETLLNDGNGLINMRKRAEDLNGRLTIKSRPGLGTELTLNIPVKK